MTFVWICESLIPQKSFWLYSINTHIMGGTNTVTILTSESISNFDQIEHHQYIPDVTIIIKIIYSF